MDSDPLNVFHEGRERRKNQQDGSAGTAEATFAAVPAGPYLPDVLSALSSQSRSDAVETRSLWETATLVSELWERVRSRPVAALDQSESVVGAIAGHLFAALKGGYVSVAGSLNQLD